MVIKPTKTKPTKFKVGDKCKFKLFQEDLYECSNKEWDDITMKLYNTTRIHWVWHNGYIRSIKDDGINFSIKMCDSPDCINMNDYV